MEQKGSGSPWLPPAGKRSWSLLYFSGLSMERTWLWWKGSSLENFSSSGQAVTFPTFCPSSPARLF